MLNWINKFIKRNRRCESGALNIAKISSYEEFMQYTGYHRQTHMANLAFEKSLIPDTYTKFTYNGYCNVCQIFVDFTVDFNYACKVDNALVPNWRESLVCPVCHLNNRMRSVVHVFDLECHPNTDSTIYITEQTTALYKLFKQSFSNTYGSEYLGDSVSHGNSNKNGIRNEDLMQLSFSDDQFDFILSFDVLEHIPNYEKALAECYRCLKTGGMFLFSVPFVQTSEKNIVRARLSQTGEIVHLLPPEYHADPINSDGCLCFYHFGWEILENLKAVGFKNSQALLYWSNEFGYLGGEQLLLFARKE